MVPVLLLCGKGTGSPTVLISPEGKASLLANQAELIRDRLAEGPVCLVDVRGVGEAGTDHPRAPQSRGAGRAATTLMIGETVLGLQVRDLRTVIAYLRSRSDIHTQEIRLEDAIPDVGHLKEGIEMDRALNEAGTRILARLVELIESDVVWTSGKDRAVAYRPLLDSWCVDWPCDAILPGALAHGDLP